MRKRMKKDVLKSGFLLSRKQRRPEQPTPRAVDVAFVRIRVGLLLREVADLDGDGVGGHVVHEGLVNLERLGEHATFGDDGALGVFLWPERVSARSVRRREGRLDARQRQREGEPRYDLQKKKINDEQRC